MLIYEVHLNSWKWKKSKSEYRPMTYKELAVELIDYVKNMGYTHIELLPVAEHPFGGSWGYQISSYFAPTSRYGTPEDFMYFIDCCHQNNIGVFVDWVPAHFPKDSFALAEFNGTALYEHSDPRQGEHPDWGTKVFNYGRHEVFNFLISNALFWCEKYHIDGLRVDAVASILYLDYSRNEGEWIPNIYGGRENLEAVEFIKLLNKTIHEKFPGVLTIAEESTAWPKVTGEIEQGGLGFDMKWNMGWMNDILSYVSKEPVHRKYHHNYLTFIMMYAFTENFILSLSHDEVVHGKGSLISKMPGNYEEKFANLRCLYGYMYGMPGKKLQFMGSEFGQFSEWNADTSLDWHLLDFDMHKKMKHFAKELNWLYSSEECLHENDFDSSGFEWIDFQDGDNSVISFVRKSKKGEILVFVCNFTPVKRLNYRIGVPIDGNYIEILNSDSKFYGGSDAGNSCIVHTEKVASHSRNYSLNLILPPLSTIILKPDYHTK